MKKNPRFQIGYALAQAKISFCPICSGPQVQQKCIALQSSIHPGPVGPIVNRTRMYGYSAMHLCWTFGPLLPIDRKPFPRHVASNCYTQIALHLKKYVKKEHECWILHIMINIPGLSHKPFNRTRSISHTTAMPQIYYFWVDWLYLFICSPNVDTTWCSG